MINLSYDAQLTLLARWLFNNNREDIGLFNKELFSSTPKLYKAICNNMTWEQIPDGAKDEIIGETKYTAVIGAATYTFLYKQAKAQALVAQRSFIIDKLETAKDAEERTQLYSDIDDISDIIEGKENTPIDRYKASEFLYDFVEDTGVLEANSVSTGFESFDNEMEGGLFSGLYILGALSSMGKTSLMLQLADQLAAQGENILYFTLEMGAHELIAKSLSRYSYLNSGKDGKSAATARSIIDKRKSALLNESQRAGVDTAKDSYYSEIANNLWFFESIGDIGTREIRREIEKHIKATGKTPIIFIDYLQILKPYSEYWTEKRNTDKAITELRKISRDYKTIVFAISSLNRGSYTGDITMDAFKESGAIEYGSDVLLGLQARNLEEGETPKERKENKRAIEEEKRKIERELELKVLKNRNGATGQRIKFKYNAMFNYFEDDMEVTPAFNNYNGIGQMF